jgi:hypothetical protein
MTYCRAHPRRSRHGCREQPASGAQSAGPGEAGSSVRPDRRRSVGNQSGRDRALDVASTSGILVAVVLACKAMPPILPYRSPRPSDVWRVALIILSGLVAAWSVAKAAPCAASHLKGAKSIRVLKDRETDLLRAVPDDTIVKRRDHMGTDVA